MSAAARGGGGESALIPTRWIAVGLALASCAWLLAGGPFLGLPLAWGAFLLHRAVRGSGRARRLLAFNLGLLLLVFAAGEAYMAARVRRNVARRSAQAVAYAAQRDELRAAGSDSTKWLRWDPDLGWAGRPNGTTRATREHDRRAIYDVQYHLDTHGLRVPPPHDPSADECLLFFGCSYTFGEGVADDETFPWQVGVKTGGRYRVVNFAMLAYGPQHMLTWLETGAVDDALLGCVPRHAFYLWIGNHLSRVSGVEPWTLGSARYRLAADASLVHDGQFGDGGGADAAAGRSWGARLLSRSALLSEVYRGTVVYGEQARLQAAVVGAARDIVESRWPGARFHVLFWDDPLSLKHAIVRSAFERAGLELTDVTDMLPEFLADEDRHWLDPTDHHPNAATHERLATYVAEQLLGSTPARAAP